MIIVIIIIIICENNENNVKKENNVSTQIRNIFIGKSEETFFVQNVFYFKHSVWILSYSNWTASPFFSMNLHKKMRKLKILPKWLSAKFCA